MVRLFFDAMDQLEINSMKMEEINKPNIEIPNTITFHNILYIYHYSSYAYNRQNKCHDNTLHPWERWPVYTETIKTFTYCFFIYIKNDQQIKGNQNISFYTANNFILIFSYKSKSLSTNKINGVIHNDTHIVSQ